MAIYQCEFKLVDECGNINLNEIFYDELKTTFQKNDSWCSDIILYGNVDDTCVEVFYYNKKIDDILVRINVGNITIEMLNSIIAFINANNLRILNNGELIKATKRNILSLIASSDALRFLKDSKKFLQEIEDNTGDGSKPLKKSGF